MEASKCGLWMVILWNITSTFHFQNNNWVEVYLPLKLKEFTTSNTQITRKKPISSFLCFPSYPFYYGYLVFRRAKICILWKEVFLSVFLKKYKVIYDWGV